MGEKIHRDRPRPSYIIDDLPFPSTFSSHLVRSSNLHLFLPSLRPPWASAHRLQPTFNQYLKNCALITAVASRNGGLWPFFNHLQTELCTKFFRDIFVVNSENDLIDERWEYIRTFSILWTVDNVLIVLTVSKQILSHATLPIQYRIRALHI